MMVRSFNTVGEVASVLFQSDADEDPVLCLGCQNNKKVWEIQK